MDRLLQRLDLLAHLSQEFPLALRRMHGTVIQPFLPFYPPEQLLFGILVDKNGKRFVNEDSYHSKTSIRCTEQPDGAAYLIADDSFYAYPLFQWQPLIDAWENIADMERDLGMPDGALQKTIADYTADMPAEMKAHQETMDDTALLL